MDARTAHTTYFAPPAETPAVTELSRRALLASAAAATASVAGCTAPLYSTTVTVVNVTDERVTVYVAVVVKRLVNADSEEWEASLEPGAEREFEFTTGQEEATEVVVDPSTGPSRRRAVDEGDVRAEITESGVRFDRA